MSDTETTNAGSRPQSEDTRRAALAVLVRAEARELTAAWNALSPAPSFETVRRPETGLVMVRGRIGGGGRPSMSAR
jgi:alpha-D-ribose 1-methylphosphonate 5-triphosphate synthase subunit PhnG